MEIKDPPEVDDFEHLRMNAKRLGNRKGQIPHDHPPTSMLKMEFMMEIYSKALASAITPEQTRAALLNRSLANLRLHRLEKAVDDASKSQDDNVPTQKGLFREAKAYYSLEQFSLCSAKLRKVLALNPKNQDAKKELARTLRRIDEQDRGIYQWGQMYDQANATPPVIDCATYNGPVEVRRSTERGRGLFTSKAVKAGDLLLCEKAFSYRYAGEDDNMDANQNNRVLVSLVSKRTVLGAQASLAFNIIQKLHHNPRLAPRFNDLHHGDSHSGAAKQQDKSIIDTFFVMDVVSLNSYGSPRTCLIQFNGHLSHKKSTTCGLWILASYINHACVGNCQRSFIGDMMILRASTDMDANTELQFCYLPPDGLSYEEVQKSLQPWGFVCRCELCEEKKLVSEEALQRRQELIRDSESTMANSSTLSQQSKAERLLGRLEETYADGRTKYRLEIGQYYVLLGMKRLKRREPTGALELIIKSLEAYGFVIEAILLEKYSGSRI
ncbi:hypothetical protein Landi51_13547 [Colletotrichum acutatum]